MIGFNYRNVGQYLVQAWRDHSNMKKLLMLVKGSDCVCHAGRVCHVWWNIKPGSTCRTNIIFGTPKDNIVKFNSYY